MQQSFLQGFVKRASEHGIGQKEAFDLNEAIYGANNFLKNNNIDQRLLGAGLGAVGGGITGALSNSNHKMRNGLAGALMGAGVGAGGGQWLKEQDQIVNPRAVDMLSKIHPSGNLTKAQQLVDPANGVNSISNIGEASAAAHNNPNAPTTAALDNLAPKLSPEFQVLLNNYRNHPTQSFLRDTIGN